MGGSWHGAGVGQKARGGIDTKGSPAAHLLVI
jgi:hypothetical protein